MASFVNPWSFAVVLIVVIAMIIFRKPITEKILQVKKASKGGVDFDTEQSKGKVPPSLAKTADDLIRDYDGPMVREIENDFKTRLEGMPDSEKIKALSRLFAAGVWSYLAINTYRLIFGSQISALDFLNTQDKIPRESLRPFYAAAAAQHPDFYQNYSYDQWIGFLESHVLVRHEADLIYITVRGRDFLQFLVKDNLSRVKPG